MSPSARFIAEASRAVFWSYLGQFRDEGPTAAGMAVYNANAIYVPAGQQRALDVTVPSGFRRVHDVALPDIGIPASATPARPAGR